MLAPASPVREALGVDADEAELAAAFSHVHQLLATVLRVVPTSMHALLPLITEHFPHKRLDAPAHIWYVRNLIKLVGYAPAMLPDILALIIERIIQLDVRPLVGLNRVVYVMVGIVGLSMSRLGWVDYVIV